MIDFFCPTCKAALRAAPEHAGAKIECPKCGQRIMIPGAVKETNKTLLGLSTPDATPVSGPGAVEAIVDPTIDRLGRPAFRCPYCGCTYPPYFRTHLSTGGVVAVVLIFLFLLPGVLWAFVIDTSGGCVALVVFLMILTIPFSVWRETNQYCNDCNIRLNR
jgi:DNA-directed RNA polymerase subunit RPC12/RpoP